MKKLQAVSWFFYDWASSVWPTVVNAFVISYYFAHSVASNPVDGSVMWGYQASAVAILLAVFSPFLGALIECLGLFFLGLLDRINWWFCTRLSITLLLILLKIDLVYLMLLFHLV